ncbi:MAG TPA: hypothetical protein ENJ28_09910 [Gammaproteobacteria bacterium]|nr:hypothetical protein [Gammaproteobacteria bacterium]
MIDDNKPIPKSVIFDVTAMSLRLIPKGRQRTFQDGDKLYKLFRALYKDVHPSITEERFLDILREIFPVYKNPRKTTECYKITTYKLKEKLGELGMKRFPADTLLNGESLKIEM